MTPLRTRLIILLSVALLPLGAVAIYQTLRVINEAERLADRDVLAQTVGAAGNLETTLLEAYGAAEALGTAAAQLGGSSDTCSAVMRRFVDSSDQYVFAGFIPRDGMLRCSSGEDVIDLSQHAEWLDFLADPRPMATVSTSGEASGQPVLIAFTPVFDLDGTTLLGGQAVSLPRWLTRALLDAAIDGVALAILDGEGDILAANAELDDVASVRALNLRPAEMEVDEDGMLLRQDRLGTRSDSIALVPLIDGRIYILGLWKGSRDRTAMALQLGGVAPIFPLLMWVASLIVAYLAVDALVLRHMSRLSTRMSLFRSEQDDSHFEPGRAAPGEIRDIAVTYNAMIDRIVSDRAALEQSIREQELLLREVHHRVKNNLQLIASILNMQRRNVEDPEARRILGRVHDRVMSLSTIHKALYTGKRVDCVRADTLLRDIASGVLKVGIPASAHVETSVSIDEVTLDPDQAVPLSLLATEALTNAAKHLGRPEDGRPARIEVSFSELADQPGTVRFSVANTCGELMTVTGAEDGSRLGARLIDAFASQLGGTLEVTESDAEHRVVLTFTKLVVLEE